LFSFFIAPLFGTVLLGMLWKRCSPAGGFWGLLSGMLGSVGMWVWVKLAGASALAIVALTPKATDMSENMYRGLWSWLICVIVTVGVSLATKPKPVSELAGLVYGAPPLLQIPGPDGTVAVAVGWPQEEVASGVFEHSGGGRRSGRTALEGVGNLRRATTRRPRPHPRPHPIARRALSLEPGPAPRQPLSRRRQGERRLLAVFAGRAPRAHVPRHLGPSILGPAAGRLGVAYHGIARPL